MPQSKRAVKDRDICVTDAIIDETIKRHGEEAQMKKVQEECVRLAPRRRIAKAILLLIKKELRGKKLVGLQITEQRMAEIAVAAAKQLARDVGIEQGHLKKEKNPE